MNWGRAKTILIVMFLVTDIFLLIVLITANARTVRIPQKTIKQSVKILSDNRISIAAETIPAKRVKSRNIIMRSFFHDPEAGAKLLLGKEAAMTGGNPEQFEYWYDSPEGTLHIQGNGFAFNSKATPKPAQKPQKEAALLRISEALNGLGLTKKTTHVYNLWEQNGIYHCDVMPMIDGKKIYGITMRLSADEERILSMEGYWFEPIEAEENEPEFLLDVTAVLTKRALANQGQFTEIVQIDSSYYASDEFLNSREIAAIPVYIMTEKNGRNAIFDGRTGARVE